MIRDACVNVLTFDIAQTASLYSQLAGVLSGFAFAALVVVLTSRLTAGKDPRFYVETTRTMVACFVGLILVSLTYAVLAGETANSGRAAMVQLAAAPGFIAAGMLLLLSILALLRAVEISSPDSTRPRPESINLVRFLLSHVAPLILTVSLYSGIDDYSDARYGDHDFRSVDLVVIIALILVVLVPFIGYLPALGYSDDSTRSGSVRILAYAAVALAAGSTVATFLLSANLNQCQTLNDWTASLAVAIPVLFMMAISIHLARSRKLD